MRVALLHLAHAPPGSHPRHHLAPLDLGYVGALLSRRGHVVLFHDSAVDGSLDQIADRMIRSAAERVVIRPAIQALPDLAPLCRRLHMAGLRVLVAGPVATTMAQELGELCGGAAEILIGEAEAVVPAAFARLEAGDATVEAADVSTATRHLEAPQGLPWPRHDWFVSRPYRFGYPVRGARRLRMGYLLGSRGCPHRCLFCSPIERASMGRRYRPRPADEVAEEARAVESLGATALYFEDDLAANDEARFEDLARAFTRARVGVPWIIQARAGAIGPDTARALARAGCSTVCVGAESGDDRVLARLNKGVTAADVRRQLHVLSSAGLLTVAFVIVGTPGEDAAAFAATSRLIRDTRPDLVQVHLFTPYPGSPAAAAGMATDRDTYADKYRGGADADAEARRVTALQARLYRDFYLSPRTWARMARRSGPFYLANLPGALGLARALARSALW